MTNKDKNNLSNLYFKNILCESISQKKVEEVPSHYMPSSDENLLSQLWKAAELGSQSTEWKDLAKQNPRYEEALLKLRDDWDELKVRFKYDLEDEYAFAHNPPPNWDEYFSKRKEDFRNALEKKRSNPNR